MNTDRAIPQDRRPVIGITLGDYNGVGPEVILKALSNNLILKTCTPVIYGSMKILSHYRKLLKLKDWYINQSNNVKQLSNKKVNLIAVGANKKYEIQPGKLQAEASQLAIESLKTAIEDWKNGGLDGIVTAPINKHGMQSEGFDFPGHTEYLTQASGLKESLMLMVAEDFRVGVVTGHIPLSNVSENLTRDKVSTKIRILIRTLQEDFGIQRPRIAVLGFNPHAGEDGLLGDEEQQIIRPVVLELKKKGALLFGPFPADGFFGLGEYQKFDAVLAMYHDQGLIPFKTIAFDRGVNFTAGLPLVRTSPDHGTAYDIAGKDMADETSLREAIFLACDVVRTRWETNA